MEIKGYSILSEISRGPITTVYLGKQEALDRHVLLKVLNIQWKNESDLIERFRREAKICARLKHSNIVNIYDFGVEGQQFFISMEYIEGQTLAELIRQNHPLPFPVVLFIVHQILSGLAYAHRFNVIHRDIKPSNIMIDADGLVKITDFGLATISNLPAVTAQGFTAGTPDYMAPEQALHGKSGDRSDLFSLGATMFELVDGKSPFSDVNLAAVLNKTINYKPPSLIKLHPLVPEWFSIVVESLLEKNPAARPSSAQSILETPFFKHLKFTSGDLANYLKNPMESTIPGSDAVESGKKKLIGRKATTKIIPIALFVSIIFVIIYLTIQLSNPLVITKKDAYVNAKENHKTGNDSSALQNMTESINSQRFPQDIENAGKNSEINETSKTDREKAPPKDAASLSAGAWLFVYCNPWADIYIDDAFQETTPLSERIPIAAGAHQIQLRNPNFETFIINVLLNENQCDTIRATLKPVAGYLKLNVLPWAKIYIDDAYLGETPQADPLSLPAGRHILRLTNPELGSIIDTVIIQKGQVLEKSVRFE